MADRSADSLDLLERMKVGVLNGRCEFILLNDTPPEYRVRIVQGGAKFFNHDGTDFTDGPHNLNLDSGQQYSFYSNDSSQCVVQVFLAIEVNIPDEGDKTFTYTTEKAPEGRCKLRAGIKLGQQNTVSLKNLQKHGVFNVLELTEE
ncbi:hypothetical protein ELI44_32930 (plasmid) [Rhizobium ruizarguesonis]|uniref:hypothetical protein n=1 Tax=Rhizobium ruizarguesonis TaxID=2081791 RepID=UPI00102F6DA8|nr:hypothetical protein [Rhizobium ruizarguesonis]TAU37813.1 hypothetical protein ELI42_33205 [Rhizobium ruizarguesonis]TAU51272.1 hypothetical protein ELI44_32930 [Rhizobium ruizarguesonis]